jgi:Protein of unknown function (DUF3040)
MGLAPGEREMLTEIENCLCRSDPGLAAMFADFSRRVFGRQGPVWERLTPWRSSWRQIVGIALLAVMVACVAGLVVIMVLTSHGQWLRSTFVPGFGTGKFAGPH